ncbi:MAG: hypothetical protein K8R85_15105 [Bacteroidetes bacterium]|nr:hypothetical protein [Bacteroidota bacterium]
MITLLLRNIQSVRGLLASEAKAELQFQSKIDPSSDFHFYYVGMEVVKVFCSNFLGITLLNKS